MSRCGECNACCKPFAVPEVGKEDGVTLCRHSCPTGCAIYAERPLACRMFQCVWLARSEMATSWRPDKLGVMFLHSVYEVPGKQVSALDVWEVRPDASQIQSVREMVSVNRTQAGMAIIIHRLNADGTTDHILDSVPEELTRPERAILIAQFKGLFSQE